jgi:hypothetical protein
MALQRWTKQTTGVYTVGTDNQTAVYTFPAIPQGFAGSVSVAVPGSGAAVDWTVQVAGQLVGSVQGAQPCGPIYLGQGDVLTISGTPVTNVGVAVASGAIGLPSEIPPNAIITSNSQGVSGANLVAISSGAGSSLTPVIPISGALRGILIEAQSSYPIGAGQGGQYLPVNNAAMNMQYGGADTEGIWFLPIFGTSSVQVEFAATTEWEIFDVTYDFDFYEVARGLGVYTVTVPNPGAGLDWSYTLPAPARLVAVGASFYTAAGGANRFPQLYMAPGDVGLGDISIPMSPSTVGPGLTGADALNGWPGAALNTVAISATESTGTFPIPDMLMASGSVIQSDTLGLGASDSWKFIQLVLSPI